MSMYPKNVYILTYSDYDMCKIISTHKTIRGAGDALQKERDRLLRPHLEMLRTNEYVRESSIQRYKDEIIECKEANEVASMNAVVDHFESDVKFNRVMAVEDVICLLGLDPEHPSKLEIVERPLLD